MSCLLINKFTNNINNLIWESFQKDFHIIIDNQTTIEFEGELAEYFFNTLLFNVHDTIDFKIKKYDFSKKIKH